MVTESMVVDYKIAVFEEGGSLYLYLPPKCSIKSLKTHSNGWATLTVVTTVEDVGGTMVPSYFEWIVPGEPFTKEFNYIGSVRTFDGARDVHLIQLGIEGGNYRRNSEPDVRRTQKESIIPVEDIVGKDKSASQHRVEEFMRRAGQQPGDVPGELPDSDAILAARLILEEALETVEALGVTTYFTYGDEITKRIEFKNLQLVRDREMDLVEVVDGCCDVRVVATWTLSKCGVPDVIPQKLVDDSNLEKFGEGGHADPETGKWKKPPDWKPPKLGEYLLNIGWGGGRVG